MKRKPYKNPKYLKTRITAATALSDDMLQAVKEQSELDGVSVSTWLRKLIIKELEASGAKANAKQ
jgi:hypothetical protein